MYRRIQDLREDQDLTPKLVVQLLGMFQTGCSEYKTVGNDIPTAELIKLADFIKLPQTISLAEPIKNN